MAKDNDRLAREDNRKATSDNGARGAGWFLAGILLVVVLGGFVYFVTGALENERPVDIELTVPEEMIPEVE